MQRCSKRTAASRIKVEERGRKAIFLNDQGDTFVVVTFDGCVVEHDTAADYIVRPDAALDVIVELKGRNVDHAERQITATYRHIKTNRYAAENVSALIVCSRVPLGGEQSTRIIDRLRKIGLRRVKIKTAQWQGEKAEFT